MNRLYSEKATKWDMFFKILWPSQNIQTLSNREITRNKYFNQSMTWTKIKKMLHFSSVAILSNSQEVVEKNATQSSFNKNVSRPIKVQQLVEYTPRHNFKKIIQISYKF